MKTATTKNSLLRWYFDQRTARAGSDGHDPEGMSLQELGSLTDLAKTGELMGPVSHEANNFVNAMLLQLSVLESKLPEDSRADLAAIREQAVGLTALVEQLRNYRQRKQGIPHPVDLHRTIRRIIHEMNRDEIGRNGKPAFQPMDAKRVAQAPNEVGAGIPVHLTLARCMIQVNDSAVDLRNLCTFLLSHAAAVTAVDGSILIRTVVSDNQVLLGVEDCGPNIDPALLPRIFEPSVASRTGVSSLELAACKGLVAKLGGRIVAQNLPGRGVAVCVQLPLVSNPGRD